jgi:hypothetical protein
MKNHFIHQDKPYKPVPVVQIVLIMVAIFLVLAALDWAGVIHVAKSRGL